MASTTAINISRNEAVEIVKAGGPTFRPLHRGRFSCNQKPELGALSRARVETVRNQVNGLAPQTAAGLLIPAPESQQPKTQPLQGRLEAASPMTPRLEPETSMEYSQPWRAWGQDCPFCGINFYVSRVYVCYDSTKVTCPACKRQFKVVP